MIHDKISELIKSMEEFGFCEINIKKLPDGEYIFIITAKYKKKEEDGI